VGIEQTREIGEGCRQADIRDVRDPGLVEPVHHGLAEEVGVGAAAVARVGGRHEAPFELAQQGFLAHHAQDPLMVDVPAVALEGLGDAAIAVTRERED
jgi:hypothetical protein